MDEESIPEECFFVVNITNFISIHLNEKRIPKYRETIPLRKKRKVWLVESKSAR
jgi:hypothetical protein